MIVTQETAFPYRLTRFGMINCFLVKENDHFILIDTGLRGSDKPILRTAENLGYPIKSIVLTHGHLDHLGSVDALVHSIPEAEFLVGSRESRIIRGDHSPDLEEIGKILFGFPAVQARPMRVIAEEDRVGPLRVISSPGHTPGHLAFFDVRDNSLIAGDAFTTQTGFSSGRSIQLFISFPFSIFLECRAGSSQRSQTSEI